MVNAASTSTPSLSNSLTQWASVASKLLSMDFPDVHVGKRSMSEYVARANDSDSLPFANSVALAASLKACCQISIGEMLSSDDIETGCSLTILSIPEE